LKFWHVFHSKYTFLLTYLNILGKRVGRVATAKYIKINNFTDRGKCKD
jgi:hypothetical protein